MVKFHYIERISNPLWPRVMGRFPRGKGLSVDRGRHRLSIELRKHKSEVQTLLDEGERKTVGCATQVTGRLLGVIRPDACVDASYRNLGGPVDGWELLPNPAVRRTEFGVTACTSAGSRMRS